MYAEFESSIHGGHYIIIPINFLVTDKEKSPFMLHPPRINVKQK